MDSVGTLILDFSAPKTASEYLLITNLPVHGIFIVEAWMD